MTVAAEGAPAPAQAPPPPSFRALLYRYLFFGWLFRDVTRGNLFERAAAWRHNQHCAPWLLVYMRRWLVLGLLLYLLGRLAEALVGQPLFSAVFYVPSVLSVQVQVVAGVAWLGLKLLPAPL